MDEKTTDNTNQGLPAYVTHAELAEALHHQHKRQKRRRAGIFLKIVGLIALVHWVGHKYGSTHHTGQYSRSFDDPEDKWPIPPETQVEKCATWSESTPEAFSVIDAHYPHSASASFNLPVESAALFLATRSIIHRHGKHHGLFAAGAIDYVQGTDSGDNVNVAVTAQYWHTAHLEAAKVCLLSKTDGNKQNGVGILTKWEDEDWEDDHDHHHGSTELRFQITVTFPAAKDGKVLDIEKFETDLEVYSQTFAGSMKEVHFKALELKSALAGITAKELTADVATLRTSLAAIDIETLKSNNATLTTALGRIEGTYNVTDSLSLTTSNAPINVDINLVTDGSNERPGNIKLVTTNAAIEANISLASSSESSPGSFDVSAHTAHGQVELPILALPIDAELNLEATTALAKVFVGLPETYEGSIEATTSLANVDIKIDSGAKDPKGEDRKRVGGVERVRRGVVNAKVGWSREGTGRGKVQARSSLGGILVEV
ncbi:DUF4097 domain-containing protein [Mycena indigotica]|uniref:DUF4097 domain-containing protein n=1 Tax=Mycena indigotica TaxID=2126181 RepID=A0A8H6W3W8_9AGAR|nr:DUF4097 domain-containing protein [Mycena indigotica]KAF7304007.1 DUF4097 domain-containing protein [Mycena indigotica]